MTRRSPSPEAAMSLRASVRARGVTCILRLGGRFAMFRVHPTDKPDVGWQLDFEGGPASVSFVARLSGMRSYPGLYRIKLAIEGSASIGSNDGRLVMYYRPYSGDQLSTRQVNDEVSIVVLDGFASASFDYRGAATAASADWVPEWRDASRLPDLVRLQFQDAHTGYATGPDLVVAVRSTTPSRLMR